MDVTYHGIMTLHGDRQRAANPLFEECWDVIQHDFTRTNAA